MKHWKHAGGKDLKGLEHCTEAEGALYEMRWYYAATASRYPAGQS